jgi:hypothetical protein
MKTFGWNTSMLMSGAIDMTPDEQNFLDGHVAKIAEHYDTVEIIVTRHENQQTLSRSRGAGNWHARYASAKEFVAQCEASFTQKHPEESA